MDILGASMALPAAILGGVQGQLGAILNKWLDYKYRCKIADDKALQDARNTKGKAFLITRRFLAISTALYIFLGPYIASIYGIPVCFTYTESNGLFTWILYGATSVHIVEVRGFVITPCQVYLASLVWSMYFGGKRV